MSEAQEYIFITSAAGRVIFPSPKTVSLLNQDITGRNLNDLIDDTHAAEFIHSAKQNMPYSITSRICHVNSLLSMIPCDSYMVITILPVASEIGLSSELHSGYALIDHEMRSPLAIILSALNLLRQSILPSDKNDQYIAQIEQNLYRMLRFVTNITDVLRFQHDEWRLNAQLRNIFSLCRETAQEVSPYLKNFNISLHLEIPETPLECYIDAEKMKRMILNIFSNAIRACNNGGSIYFSAHQHANNVILKITDTGNGFSEDTLSYAFSKHMSPIILTSTENGAGLGMTIIKAIAQLHHGSAVIESNPESGTSVTVSFPISQNSSVSIFGNNFFGGYASGFDPILLELSSVLPYHAFLANNQHTLRKNKN